VKIFANFRKFSQIFANFHKFSQIFTNFRKFSQIFANFHKFSQIFTNFRKFSQIFANFHKLSKCANSCEKKSQKRLHSQKNYLGLEIAIRLPIAIRKGRIAIQNGLRSGVGSKQSPTLELLYQKNIT
jgi:hypothetical protein